MTIYKVAGSSHLQLENRFSRYFSIGETDTAIIRYQASTRELADADLLASALLKSFAVIVRLTEARAIFKCFLSFLVVIVYR